MPRKRQEEPEKDNGERWLLTYSDLITLLMVFFVVLYSMSQIDANKFKAVAESLNAALGGGGPTAQIDVGQSPSGPSIFETGNPQSNTQNPGTNKEIDKSVNAQNAGQGTQPGQGNSDAENMTIEGIKSKLDKFAADNGIQTQLVSSVEERGLVISIQETLLFESGSADVTPRAREILDKINTVLASAPNYIKVEGHTDNLPISTTRFPSNWELSVLRATNVLHIMAAPGTISPDRLSAAGYGEFRPLTSNDTDAGRARNRRVDLVILRSKYDSTEPGSPAASSSNSAQSSTTK
ncbi:OmpA/MotB family protein [Desulfitobacterium metallireducens]|uniref:Flagellar motor protein n=1 Tax=Desulfitobacterium metallireducens DSM 15288 TaxID=871968 RepID=W0EAC3_9FIRM|nr:flagellar motor protein MotB [Desulfitobacterium metallireducens]AHF07815.1 flagellar motor protein [Desulfitobacterium metallireducens DSM 15288]